MSPKQPLCNTCLRLNLTAFFESKIINKHGVKEFSIPMKRPGSLPDLAGCALCSILSRSILFDLSGGEALTPIEEDCVLRAIKFLWLPDKQDVLALITCTRRFSQVIEDHKFKIVEHIRKGGHAVLERTSEQNKPLLEIPSDTFNSRQTLDWITECRRHGCNPSEQRIYDQYLVDCHDLAVVAAGESPEYVALSYVWAPPGESKITYNLRYDDDKKMLLLPEKLPLVVADAIIVTKSLGFRYLWIDKFCIGQNEEQPEMRHKQIMQMDAIYANSALTIIAAAGQDESYGLPGVSNRSRVATPAVKIGESNVYWFQNPYGSIQKSKWNTRGWTYQEGLLARRRLVFLDDQTYFECGTEEHCEMVLRPPSTCLPCDYGYQGKGLWNYVQGHRDSNMRDYFRLVREYTVRSLRYDSDSLLAVLGILRHLQTTPLKLDHVWGIPQSVAAPRGAAILSSSDVFVAGLCWNHVRSCWESSGKPKRRSKAPFSVPSSSVSPSSIPPSWTWAGWVGEAEFYAIWDVGLECCPIRMRPRQCRLEDQRGSPESTAGVGKEPNPNKVFRDRILFIETWAISPDKICFREMPDGLVDWTVHGHAMKRVYLSEGADSEAKLARKLKSKRRRWRCILLGTSQSLTRVAGSVILLILRRRGDDLWLRVGIMVLDCYPPNMVELDQELSFPTEEFRIK
ncbi:HET-domain-containing protein [Hypoxylon rubiginosum]|uniref:HET-domain-containing protein n=1 Tax=Hypoxylon rubiginosum TaxID=110542 RepID=A0ACC0DJ13_9PEZI|nr:HET-domain-containing protein [Hypoxylon rubiginosum]